MQENKPHSAIIHLRFEIQRKLDNGQMSGSSIESGTKLIKIDGRDLQDCRSKLEETLKQLGK